MVRSFTRWAVAIRKLGGTIVLTSLWVSLANLRRMSCPLWMLRIPASKFPVLSVPSDRDIAFPASFRQLAIVSGAPEQ